MSRGTVLQERYSARLAFPETLLTSPSGRQLLEKLDIPTYEFKADYVHSDDIYWLSAYLAGMGITTDELKAGLPNVFIDIITASYTQNLEESEDEMFIAGVAASTLNHDKEVTTRYARVKALTSELYHVPETTSMGGKSFLSQFTRRELTAFAHYLAGSGYTTLIDMFSGELLEQRAQWDEGKEMDSFIKGFISSE
jgi:hypothetical protein